MKTENRKPKAEGRSARRETDFGVAIAGLLLLLTAGGMRAETDGFLCQTITLPAKAMSTRFADLNGGGRFDLLAVDSNGKRLLIYRQRAAGFTNTPDQIIELPPHTAWIAPAHVEAGMNLDLLASTATGLFYYRQDGGVFEPEPRLLLETNQAFTGDDSPVLLSAFTNAAIPIISARQAWFYQRNDKFEWTSSPPALLEPKHGNWYGTRNGGSGWSMGPDAARTLTVERSFLSMPRRAAGYIPENDAIATLISRLKTAGLPPGSTEADLERDGRKDLIVWQFSYESWRTDLYVFLRGPDGKLPERPTQILHCRGVPIPVNSTVTQSPIADLKGDGRHELVLMDRDFIVTSIGSLVDTALTRGVNMAITVRPFSHGAFARDSDKAVTFKTLLSWYGTWQWTVFICGDFNGDGHPDLVVMRPAGEWEIYYSSGDDRWFQPRPAMAFELPAQSYFERRYFEITDLNGDGRSDIVSEGLDDPRLFIFLTQPENPKGHP